MCSFNLDKSAHLGRKNIKILICYEYLCKDVTKMTCSDNKID